MDQIPSHESFEALCMDIVLYIEKARKSVIQTVNSEMVLAYWQIGRRIIQEEQRGRERAVYGGSLLRHLSKRLMSDYGSGFSATNLSYMRQFYLTFRERIENAEDNQD